MEPTAALVQRLVERLFAAPERAAALRLLEQYGTRDSEPYRVRVALLKLSDGRLDQLEDFVRAAHRDFRDVLAWAEYPEALRQPMWSLPAEEALRIRDADRAQYLAWLHAHTGA
jgi:hypothetical protein